MRQEKQRAETGLQRGVHGGLFGQAGGMGANYALTRREGYARMFAWLIRRASSHSESKPTTYGGP